MDTCDLYEKGVCFEEFVNEDNDIYKEKILEIYNTIEFEKESVDRIKNIDKRINILICAELWCPDCIINVPVIEKMRQYNNNISLSIVQKEGNEDFFKKFAVRETIRVPIFVIYNEDFKELGSFIEYPKEIIEIINNGNESKVIVTKRKYQKGEYANETLKDVLEVICR